MPFSLPATKTAHVSMIALALMAALPELVCCCDVSWGPGGLLGSEALCQETRSGSSCCCCDLGDSQQDEPQDERAAESCRCTFTAVSPAPITHDRDYDLDLSQCYAAVWSADLVAADEPLSTTTRLAAPASPPLTSAHRCALRQTWLL